MGFWAWWRPWWGLRDVSILRYGFGLLLMGLGLVYVWVDPVRWAVTRWTDLGVILAPVLLNLWAARGAWAWRPRWQAVLEMVLAVLTLWCWVSRWAGQSGLELNQSVVWSLLALLIFVGGLFSRERVYRLAGLGILAVTLGRIVFVDLWQFGTLSRIASLLVAGLVLGVLGYIYNRYGDWLRKYL
ncbi:MAG: DUF2339 domain-containing protein [Blastochloris sp.]|nr:DUF2339 domain-containing protein [Blastochloris sp.]